MGKAKTRKTRTVPITKQTGKLIAELIRGNEDFGPDADHLFYSSYGHPMTSDTFDMSDVVNVCSTVEGGTSASSAVSSPAHLRRPLYASRRALTSAIVLGRGYLIKIYFVCDISGIMRMCLWIMSKLMV